MWNGKDMVRWGAVDVLHAQVEHDADQRLLVDRSGDVRHEREVLHEAARLRAREEVFPAPHGDAQSREARASEEKCDVEKSVSMHR